MENPVTPVQIALNEGAPRVYGDSFGVQLGWADISIALLHLGRPVGIVTIPHGIAKALVGQINKALDDFQQGTGTDVYTPAELEAMIQQTGDKGKAE